MDFDELMEDNSEEFVRNLKIAFFDVAARNQILMDQIELALSQETNLDRIDSLQRLWADYHDSVKGCINGVYLACTSLKKLQECARLYENLLVSKTEEVSVIENDNDKVNNVTNMIQDAVSNAPVDAIVEAPVEVVQEEPQFTPIAEPPSLVAPTIEEEPTEILQEAVPEEDSAITPVTVEDNNLPPVETLVEEEHQITEVSVDTPEVAEEIVAQAEEVPTTVEEPTLVSTEAFAPVETEAPVVISSENLPDITIPEEAKIENKEPVSEEPTMVSSEEVKTDVEEPPIAKEITDSSEINHTEEEITPKITVVHDEAPTSEKGEETPNKEEVEEASPLEKTTEEAEPQASITKIEVIESPTLEEDIPAQSKPVEEKEEKEGSLLPIINPIENEEEEKKEEEKEETAEEKTKEDNKGLLELAPEPEKKDEVREDLEVFVKESFDDSKAILVTKNQAQKLRYSKDLQSTLVHSIQSSSLPNESSKEDNNITEEELEDMVNQLSSLYEQGKMEEAEKMSDRISILSKKLNLKPAA